jgi:ribose transport system permease protein
VIDRVREQGLVGEMIDLLDIQTAGSDAPAGSLSGGNQQKVVIAKWLMAEPRIILLNDPTRGIDVGTKQEIYVLLRRLADEGAAIVFYSTDYDELIGCCDRALVLYNGARRRRDHRAGADRERAQHFVGRSRGRSAGAMSDWRYLLAQNRATLLSVIFFVVMFAIYASNHPAGFSANVVQTAANKGVLLALVAMAQTFVVITAGIDLSVGAVFVLTNCVASWIVVGTAASATLGVLGVLLTGLACGAVNGLIVIYGRLQPIVATIASGAVFFGLALLLRPVPGGDVYGPLADGLTGRIFGVLPASLVALAGVVLLVWIPYSRSAIGRATYAVGSSETAAYMSGVPVDVAKFCAYLLSGFVAALGGLFLTFVTYSGEASAANGNTYTLFSIAAVVLGGVSLFGGSGSAIGAIFGALMFRTIGDLLFVFNLDPLWQPLFQGLVLLAAVCVGSAKVFQVRNRLELFP